MKKLVLFVFMFVLTAFSAVAAPKRVAIYDVGILDIMDHVGYEDFEISVLSVPAFLLKGDMEKYSKKGGPDLGNHRDLTTDPLKVLRPDVVILGSRFRTMEEKIKKEFPKAVVYQAAVEPTNYAAGLDRNFQFLKETFPKAAPKLETARTEIQQDIKNFAEKAKSFKGSGLVLLANGKSIATYGAGGRFDMIHSAFGIKDILTEIKDDVKLETSGDQAHGSNINYEFFTKVNPDVLFFVDRNVSSGDGAPSESITDLMNSNHFKNTKAFKNKKIVNLDATAFYVQPGGFSSTKRMIKDLEEIFKK